MTYTGVKELCPIRLCYISYLIRYINNKVIIALVPIAVLKITLTTALIN